MTITLAVTEVSKASFITILIKNQADLSHEMLQPYQKILSQKLEDKDNGITIFYEADRIIAVVALKVNTHIETGIVHEEARVRGGNICKRINYEKSAHAVVVRGSDSVSKGEVLAFTEGIALANYQFLKYKSDKKQNALTNVALMDAEISPAEIDELNNIITANQIARDLGNEPVVSLNAVDLGDFIVKMSHEIGFKADILNKSQIEALRMGGLLGVNAGSSVPPTFSILEYKPDNAKNVKPLIFVGKGVTYDTGGYSIKTGPGMPGMKMDMSGAAAVVGTFYAIVKNKLPVYCIGLIPATDNRINSNALVPDDIITMHSGATVEVLNTDAEGRLILGDALSYAKKFQPELVIDLATLTGAAAAITGALGGALMGTDTKYRPTLMACGNETYERLWEIPYWREYADMLKSDIADLKNIGGAVGGSATAGKFLEHFTDYPWLHLDIAGPAILKDDEPYKLKGASGVGVRLLYAFTKKFAELN
jgi:leucyl aminopeptidase